MAVKNTIIISVILAIIITFIVFIDWVINGYPFWHPGVKIGQIWERIEDEDNPWKDPGIIKRVIIDKKSGWVKYMDIRNDKYRSFENRIYEGSIRYSLWKFKLTDQIYIPLELQKKKNEYGFKIPQYKPEIHDFKNHSTNIIKL